MAEDPKVPRMLGVFAQLETLRADLHIVRGNLDANPVEQLLEVNERLVLAALRADGIAEHAADKLEELTRIGQKDALTDTPTRAVMLDRMKVAIALARRHRKRLAILFIDIDNFKDINDSLGHAIGDSALQEVSRRLTAVLRESDTLSRQGGDEFLVLLAEIATNADAGVIAAKMLGALAVPFSAGGHVLQLSASFGISVFPDDGEDPSTLVERADAAMYRSKKLNPGSFQYFGSVEKSEPAVHRRNAAPDTQVGLREANASLVLAALSAQERDEIASASHLRQIKFMAMIAHELRNPLAPIRVARRASRRCDRGWRLGEPSASGDPAASRLHGTAYR